MELAAVIVLLATLGQVAEYRQCRAVGGGSYSIINGCGHIPDETKDQYLGLVDNRAEKL